MFVVPARRQVSQWGLDRGRMSPVGGVPGQCRRGGASRLAIGFANRST